MARAAALKGAREEPYEGSLSSQVRGDLCAGQGSALQPHCAHSQGIPKGGCSAFEQMPLPRDCPLSRRLSLLHGLQEWPPGQTRDCVPGPAQSHTQAENQLAWGSRAHGAWQQPPTLQPLSSERHLPPSPVLELAKLQDNPVLSPRGCKGISVCSVPGSEERPPAPGDTKPMGQLHPSTGPSRAWTGVGWSLPLAVLPPAVPPGHRFSKPSILEKVAPAPLTEGPALPIQTEPPQGWGWMVQRVTHFPPIPPCVVKEPGTHLRKDCADFLSSALLSISLTPGSPELSPWATTSGIRDSA